VGGQFKDASAQNGCRAIHLLLEKTSRCPSISIRPSVHPSIHPSIYLSLYRTPQIGGVGGTRALAHSIIGKGNQHLSKEKLAMDILLAIIDIIPLNLWVTVPLGLKIMILAVAYPPSSYYPAIAHDVNSDLRFGTKLPT